MSRWMMVLNHWNSKDVCEYLGTQWTRCGTLQEAEACACTVFVKAVGDRTKHLRNEAEGLSLMRFVGGDEIVIERASGDRVPSVLGPHGPAEGEQ